MRTGFISTAAALALLGALSGPALADREPNAQERAAIEQVLRDQGFTQWGDIELDDGRWEVEDAVASDGAEYDLALEQTTFEIVKRDRDD
ncbi:MAG: PepSY domain-containing protein [Hyphomicrobium sp.]|nr:PepSY domain-containing protein [Hyphomicrobium sp.]